MVKRISDLDRPPSVSPDDLVPMVDVSAFKTCAADFRSVVGAGVETSFVSSVIVPNSTSTPAASDHYEPMYFGDYDPDAYCYYVEADFVATAIGQSSYTTIVFKWFSAVNGLVEGEGHSFGGGLVTSFAPASKPNSSPLMRMKWMRGRILVGGVERQGFEVDSSGVFSFSCAGSSSSCSSPVVTGGVIDLSSGAVDLTWDSDPGVCSVVVDYMWDADTILYTAGLVVRGSEGIAIRTRGTTSPFVSRPFMSPTYGSWETDPSTESSMVVDRVAEGLLGPCEVRLTALFLGCPPVIFFPEPTSGECHGLLRVHKMRTYALSNELGYTGISLPLGSVSCKSVKSL